MIKKDEQNNLTKSFDRFECGLLPWTKIVLDQTYPLTEYNETVAPGEQSTSHPDILQSVPAIKRLVLCSESPRRQELLRLCGWPFSTSGQALDENNLITAIHNAGLATAPAGTLTPVVIATQTCLALAAAKARAAYLNDQNESGRENIPATIYIGSDTFIWFENRIIGKPLDDNDARSMLHSLSGKQHQVFTAVSILNIQTNKKSPEEYTFLDAAWVTFQPLDDLQRQVIDLYIATGSPLDKAGAYGIQDAGSLLVQSIQGDYYTIMGLPVTRLYRQLYPLMEQTPNLN
ncbi:MAG: Maf family protein [Fastidiosipilaceae bacterium]|nr:septum formation protein Maf [Clostridiaceae bacterium]